jgi:hypothetical protein
LLPGLLDKSGVFEQMRLALQMSLELLDAAAKFRIRGAGLVIWQFFYEQRAYLLVQFAQKLELLVDLRESAAEDWEVGWVFV